MRPNHSLAFSAIFTAAVVWLAGYLSILADNPSLLSPYSLPVVVPALYIGEAIEGFAPTFIAKLLSATPIAIFSLIWLLAFPRKDSTIPFKSVALFVVALVLSAAFLFLIWPSAIAFYGLRHTLLVFSFSASFVLVLWLLFFANRKKGSPRNNLAFHILLFGWLAWCAFPWLGALP